MRDNMMLARENAKTRTRLESLAKKLSAPSLEGCSSKKSRDDLRRLSKQVKRYLSGEYNSIDEALGLPPRLDGGTLEQLMCREAPLSPGRVVKTISADWPRWAAIHQALPPWLADDLCLLLEPDIDLDREILTILLLGGGKMPTEEEIINALNAGAPN